MSDNDLVLGSAPLGEREPLTERKRVAVEKILRAELGPAFLDALAHPETTDVRFNGAGLIIAKQRGLYKEIGRISPTSALCAIYAIAELIGAIINDKSPLFAGEFPLDGSRMQILLPPAVDNPVLVLRTASRASFSFDELVAQGVVTRSRADYLINAVANGEDNIAVTGATGSGKTTFCNALLREIGKYPRLMVLFEDEKELQPVSDPVYIERVYAKKGFGHHPDVLMTELIAIGMRLDPTIVSMGELRQPLAAIALLDLFNTGHRGGFVTWHANSALDTLYRLQWLIQEGGITPLPKRIACAINIVVHLKEVAPGVRRVTEMARVRGHDGSEYLLDYID